MNNLLINSLFKILPKHLNLPLDYYYRYYRGHESKVIEGAQKTILNYHPTLLVEIEQRHLSDTSITKIFEQIMSLGYDGFFLQNKQLTSIDFFEVNSHQNLSKMERANYINNFIFINKQTNI